MGKRKGMSLIPCSTSSSSTLISRKKQCVLFWGSYGSLSRTPLPTVWFKFDLPDDNDDKLWNNCVSADDSVRLRKLFSLNPEFEQLFYRYNFTNSHLPTTLSPFCLTSRNYLLFSAIVQLGSIVYAFGGNPARPTRKVWYFSLTSDDANANVNDQSSGVRPNLWKRAPSMRSRRAHSSFHVVSLRGKLYVMGGNRLSCYRDVHSGKDMTHFAEVYDPCKKKWSYLPPPPSRLSFKCNKQDSLCVIDQISNKILLCPTTLLRPQRCGYLRRCDRNNNNNNNNNNQRRDPIFIYNTEAGSWEESTDDHVLLCHHTIYRVVRYELLAYDLSGKYTFDPCEIKELREAYLQNDNWIRPEPNLFPLDNDGNLCIYWFSPTCGVHHKVSCHFLKIRVSQTAPIESPPPLTGKYSRRPIPQSGNNISLFASTQSYCHFIIDHEVQKVTTSVLSDFDRLELRCQNLALARC